MKFWIGITSIEEPYWTYWGPSLNCEKRKRLHKKTIQLPQEWLGTPTRLLFNHFGQQYGGDDFM